jgi:GNAT superfamily N-acetyltransferase
MAGHDFPIAMVHEDLQKAPIHDLPSGFALRWYRPGDEIAWVRIQNAATPQNPVTAAVFAREFGPGQSALPDRQCYLLGPDGTAIGTATAWHDGDHHGRPFGLVHWVAVTRTMQGRGLAKPLLGAVCRRLRELGDGRAYLTTSTSRLPAIRLYLKFGFVPEIRTAYDAAVWRALRRHTHAKRGAGSRSGS